MNAEEKARLDNICGYCSKQLPHEETGANSCLKKLSIMMRNMDALEQ